MLAKLFRKISTLLLVLLVVFCVCFWVAIRHHLNTTTHDEKVVSSLAGRQVDSKVVQKAPLMQNVVKTASATDSEHQFKEYQGKEVKTLHNLCIEDDPSREPIEIAANVTVNKKILVVYSSTKDSLETMNVAHTENKPDDGLYQIHYYKGIRPEHFRYIEDYPAYFTTPSCTANLHHFWADSTEGLYKTLKFTNRLGSTVPNQVININIIIITIHAGLIHSRMHQMALLFSISWESN